VIARLRSVLHARNLEFLRDRSTLVFTLLLPVMLVIGMGFVFGGPERALFKVGVLTDHIERASHPFLRERYIDFIAMPAEGEALRKLTHQQVDLLVDLREPPRYWVNTDSPKGYIVERLLLAAAPGAQRQPVSGAALAWVMGFSLMEPWIVASFVLYLLVGACWLPVVLIQMALRDLARAARDARAPLPAKGFASSLRPVQKA